MARRSYISPTALGLDGVDTSSGVTSNPVEASRENKTDIKIELLFAYSSATAAEAYIEQSEDGTDWYMLEVVSVGPTLTTHRDRLFQKAVPGGALGWVIDIEDFSAPLWRITVTTDGDSGDTVTAKAYQIKRFHR